MLLFRSEEHAERWTEQRGLMGGGFMTVEQQWELSRTWYAGRLEPGFRRRTLDEAQAVLEGIGLTDPFWSLSG